MNLSTLHVKRAKDREAMACLVEKLADQHGIPHSREEHVGPREIWVRIETPEGLALTVDFDGETCQPGVFVLSWHMVKRGVIIASLFGADRNTCHYRKATDVCHGFSDLMDTLEVRFQTIEDGLAVEPLESEVVV